MATERILKPSKWFSNKGLRLSLHRRKSRSSNSSSSSPRSPMSLCTTPKNINNNGGEGDDGLREVFHHFDRDRDGKISAYELRSYFGSIGEYMSHEEAEGVIHDLDADGDNLLDFNDFMKLMKGEGCRQFNDTDEDLRKAFEMFVWEKEGGGCITPKGLQRMLNRLGDDKSYDECVAMIDAFDTDHNGGP
ncbi:EF-Hand 1, calcium-binding site [Sesbania bispinosa]|nr:EF-Hand 1, calcium-binding site [Sesbania bispinosa]